MAEYDEVAAGRVERAHAYVVDQFRRADAKAGSLLPLFGGGLAGVVALTTRTVPVVAGVLLWLAVLPMTASVLVLLSAVRPRFSTRDTFGFVHLAGFADRPSALVSELADDPAAGMTAQAVEVSRFSLLVQSKYRRVRLAVDLLMCGVLLLVVSLVVTAVA